MNEPLKEYRSYLTAAHQKSQEDYDKTVLSLSGGALAVSFAFVKDVIGAGPVLHKELLFSSWICWGMGVTIALFSYYTSNLALRRAVLQVDAGKIHSQRAGGGFSFLTAVLNALGGVLFFAGVVTITVFVWFNLEAR